MTRLGLWQGVRRRLGFFGGIITELRKVTWPSRQELTRLTGLVLAVLIVFGLLLGVTDFGFSRLIDTVFLANR